MEGDILQEDGHAQGGIVGQVEFSLKGQGDNNFNVFPALQKIQLLKILIF